MDNTTPPKQGYKFRAIGITGGGADFAYSGNKTGHRFQLYVEGDKDPHEFAVFGERMDLVRAIAPGSLVEIRGDVFPAWKSAGSRDFYNARPNITSVNVLAEGKAEAAPAAPTTQQASSAPQQQPAAETEF